MCSDLTTLHIWYSYVYELTQTHKNLTHIVSLATSCMDNKSL